MAIPFESLATALTAFDNDLILSVSEDEGYTPRAENVPCHLSITQADNPASAQMVGGAKLPIIMYGKIYFGQDTVIKPDDIVVVEKHALDGTVLATYKGKCGVPSVRQGRKEAVFEITQVTQIEPEPVDQSFAVDIYRSDGYGGYEWVQGDFMVTAFERDNLSYIQFGDGWTIQNSKVYYRRDDGYGGYTLEQVKKYSSMRKHGTTERFQLQADPVDEGGLIGWTAQIEWRI